MLILSVITRYLLYLHNGTFVVKCKALAFFSLPLGTAAWCLSKITGWTLSNADYIAGVLACIAIDHIIGTIYHAFKKRDFCFKKNGLGLITKLSFCAVSVILFEILHNTVAAAPWGYQYLKIITRLTVLLYPAGSAFMNMSALTNGVFPPLGWIKKIKAFNADLDLDKFKTPNGQNNP